MRRNQTRDYLDIAALAERMGPAAAAAALDEMDVYYADQHAEGDGSASQVARQLSQPSPADVAVTRQLNAYKPLDSRWADWDQVKSVLRSVAKEMVIG